MKKNFLILGIIIGLTIIGWGIFKLIRGEIISPLGRFSSEKEGKEGVKVVGFLPTWMVGKTMEYKNEVDSLVFLGVEMGEDGSLIWDVQSKKVNNEAYLSLKEDVSKSGGKNILGIKLFKDKEMDILLKDEEARKRGIEEIKAMVTVAGFDGVNLDFEYMSNPMRLTEDDFLSWVEEMRNYNVGEITVDVFANTVIKGDADKLKSLLNKVDGVIVMAYDFHRPSSDFAGAVAPIESPTGERSISEVVQKMIEYELPKEKMIMAYPLYGYLWQVESSDKGSGVVGGGRMVSFNEARNEYAEANWDEEAMVPWVSFSEEETRTRNKRVLVNKRWRTIKENYKVTVYYQAFFENERSLAAKLDLARQAEVAGVGFWALGYEGENRDLWTMIRERLNTKL